jgi:hypothetical protein
MTQPDQAWKAAFRILMPQFVQFFFPQYFDDVDWEKGVEFLDKELNKLLSKAKLKNRIADVLVKLYLKSGETIWVLLHVEVQGYVEADFAQRVHQMSYRIEDLFGQNPAMLCIFTDSDPLFHPKEYSVSTWGSSKKTVFHTYKVLDNPPNPQIIPKDIVSIIMEIAYYGTQSKKLNDDTKINLYLPLVRRLYNEGYSREIVEIVLNFIEAHLKFADYKKERIFEEKKDIMAKYETTEDILAAVSYEKRALKAEAAIEIKSKEIEVKSKEIEIKSKEIEIAITKMEKGIFVMLNQGLSAEFIANSLDVTIEYVLSIQQKYKQEN